MSLPQIAAQDSNAEYIYIIENKEVWFIDYIIGIAFKTPIDYKQIWYRPTGIEKILY